MTLLGIGFLPAPSVSLLFFKLFFFFLILSWDEKVEMTSPKSFLLQTLVARIISELLFVTVMFIMMRFLLFATSKTQGEDLKTSNTLFHTTLIWQE